MKNYLSIRSGPGISLGTLKRFFSEDYPIVLRSHSSADNIYLSEKLKDDSIIVCYEAGNAVDLAQLPALIEKYKDERLEVVHYNSGVLHYDSNAELIMEGMEKQMPEVINSEIIINITGALVILSKTIPVMTVCGSGTILLISAGLCLEAAADLLTVSIRKAGMRVL